MAGSGPNLPRRESSGLQGLAGGAAMDLGMGAVEGPRQVVGGTGGLHLSKFLPFLAALVPDHFTAMLERSVDALPIDPNFIPEPERQLRLHRSAMKSCNWSGLKRVSVRQLAKFGGRTRLPKLYWVCA